MYYPNKIYVSEYKGTSSFDGVEVHRVIVTVGSDIETVREHVKEKIGIDVPPMWLMNCTHPILYTSNGSKPLEKQVKILSNHHYHNYK